MESFRVLKCSSRLESFRALKLSGVDSFRALKLSNLAEHVWTLGPRLESFRALKLSNLATESIWIEVQD